MSTRKARGKIYGEGLRPLGSNYEMVSAPPNIQDTGCVQVAIKILGELDSCLDYNYRIKSDLFGEGDSGQEKAPASGNLQSLLSEILVKASSLNVQLQRTSAGISNSGAKIGKGVFHV